MVWFYSFLPRNDAAHFGDNAVWLPGGIPTAASPGAEYQLITQHRTHAVEGEELLQPVRTAPFGRNPTFYICCFCSCNDPFLMCISQPCKWTIIQNVKDSKGAFNDFDHFQPLGYSNFLQVSLYSSVSSLRLIYWDCVKTIVYFKIIWMDGFTTKLQMYCKKMPKIAMKCSNAVRY